MKMACLNDRTHRQRTEEELYTHESLGSTTLCLKSLGADVELAHFLQHAFPTCTFIGLVRDGYAFCNGAIRRGSSAEDAGRIYSRTMSAILRQREHFDRCCIVRFEELLKDPFGTARELYEFCDLDQRRVTKLRLKSKRVLTANGGHEARFGTEGTHYWFGPTQIHEALDSNVDARQAACLSNRERDDFQRVASRELERLHYL